MKVVDESGMFGRPFSIFIHKDTREDHKRCIAISWNPMVFLFKRKTNLVEMIMVDDLLAN
jgi:hypothetical protein